MLKKTIIFSLFIFLFQTHAPLFAADPPPLAQLQQTRGERQSVDKKAESVALRPKAQKEAAFEAGIKAGTKWRYGQIMDIIVEPNQAELDALFNFTPLLIRKGEVTAYPPIITRAGAALRQTDDGIVSVQKGSYKFVQSATIVTGVPTWRNYLYMEIPEPEELHPSILPVGSEVTKWKTWVKEGWDLGIRNAETLFESNVARLVRDYNGMLIYYGLASEGMIARPVIHETRTGTHITAKEIIYDRSLYKVTKDGNFQKSSNKKIPTVKNPSTGRAKSGGGKSNAMASAKNNTPSLNLNEEEAKKPKCTFARNKSGKNTNTTDCQ